MKDSEPSDAGSCGIASLADLIAVIVAPGPGRHLESAGSMKLWTRIEKTSPLRARIGLQQDENFS